MSTPADMGAVGPPLVGWVVDAQVDFLRPDGRLYVRDLFDDSDAGAAQIVPALEDVVGWMRDRCAVVVYTGDWHGHEDPEIDSVAPDPEAGTYPPHCMGRSSDADERAGAEIIGEIRPAGPLILPHDGGLADAEQTARRAVDGRLPVFVQKTRFDVFEGNAACEAFVGALVAALGGSTTFVVAGVARDVCVTQAVDGLIERGYDVAAVRDATWGLGLEPEEVTLERWAGVGRVVTVSELLS
ncbi:MAG: isochorismatase family protein [Gemmatimonadetes bacterium]|nr:isochorismatase family protein [Gemmatimonadota bacterium]MCY3943369.1 isochorismatase family protein [Gemmatimonadota bacterium]